MPTDAGDLIAALTTREELTIYNLSSVNAASRFSFTNPVVDFQFSQDGKRLLAVTADQMAYILDSSQQNVKEMSDYR
jgi:hypothetical protein